MFAYCLNNPVNMFDDLGEKPGELFKTIDKAAIDFAKYYNKKSIKENREFVGYIYMRLKK